MHRYIYIYKNKNGKKPSDLVPPLQFSITLYAILCELAGKNVRNFVLSDNKINEQKIYQRRKIK